MSFSWFLVRCIPSCTLAGVEKVSNVTLGDWTNYIREEAKEKMNSAQLLGGRGSKVEIDERLFKGCRKGNVGRMGGGSQITSTPGLEAGF